MTSPGEATLVGWSFFSDPQDDESGMARFERDGLHYSYRFKITEDFATMKQTLLLKDGTPEMARLLAEKMNESGFNIKMEAEAKPEKELPLPPIGHRGPNSITFTNADKHVRDLRDMVAVLVNMLGGSVSITQEDRVSMGTSYDLSAIDRGDGTVILKVSV